MSNLEMQKSFSSSSCQQRLMQKVRQLSAAALWSKSFNPLHLSSLPPPPPPLTGSSISFPLFPPPRSSSCCLAHIFLLTCWSDANLSLWSCCSFFTATNPGRASPINPSPRKSANQPAKISRLAKLQEICHLPNI